MCCFYHTSNTINLVWATKYTAFWVIKYCVFMKDLVDCSATTHGVIFAKYVAQITKQQGRYAVGHRVLWLILTATASDASNANISRRPRGLSRLRRHSEYPLRSDQS